MDEELKTSFLEGFLNLDLSSKKKSRRRGYENFGPTNFSDQNENYILIESYLTLTENKNKSTMVEDFSSNVEKFYDSIISQRWENIAKNHNKTKTSKKDKDFLPKTILDLILSNIIKDFPPNTIDRLVFEEFLTNFRTLNPKDFLIYCKGIEKISKKAEKLAQDENTLEQYRELCKPKVKI